MLGFHKRFKMMMSSLYALQTFLLILMQDFKLILLEVLLNYMDESSIFFAKSYDFTNDDAQ